MMAKNSDILKNFELMLKENVPNQSSILYSGKNISPCNINSKILPSFDEVICNVSKQIKSIQSADCRKNIKVTTENINKYKKSIFIPVNMLDGAELMPHNTNLNIETQCVTDTQLINIVQDAEELISHKGMTQEFDTTFSTQALNTTPVQIITEVDDKIKIEEVEKKENDLVNKEPIFQIIDISLKEPDRTDDADSLFNEGDENNDEQFLKEVENEPQIDILKNTLIIDEEEKQNNSNDVDLPSSPVFNVKAVKKSTTLPPLVFELEAFEQFEKIALPIVEKSTDQVTAKCLINSQILGKELCLQSETDPVLYEDEPNQVSPVIEWSGNKFHFDQVVEYLPEKDNSAPETKSTQSSILKDEILFSSDEENECGLQEYYVEDLPFTCALATSFYEQPDVLDKTMYVGFQTASNKSIQICTESFYKAKSILDDFETTLSVKPNLTELVEMCDVQNSTATYDSIKVESNVSVPNKIKTVGRDSTEFLSCKDHKTTPKHEPANQLPTLRELSEKSVRISQTFEGSKTASNKKIYMSEKYSQLSKIIFKDININENDYCELMTAKKTTCENSEINITENENPLLQQETVKDKKELNLDESILLEFENNDMSHDNVGKYKKSNQFDLKDASNTGIQRLDNASENSKIFRDIESHVNNTSDSNKYLVKCLEQSNVGFKTASNKEIKISDQAMARTASLFSDIDILDDKYVKFEHAEKKFGGTDLRKDVCAELSTSKTSFDGFKTASNKIIKISDVALVKTKNIFKDIGSVLNENNACFAESKSDYPNKVSNKRLLQEIDDTPGNSEYTLNSFVGFQTASNKRIKLSKEAMIKSRNILFEEVEKDAIGKDSVDKLLKNMESNINKTQFQGFQTVNRIPVTVSTDATKNCEVILEKNQDVIDNTQNSSKSSTANNKRINIIEQNLYESYKLFEYDKDVDIKEIKCENQFKGFKTASNKLITISEDALAKSKKVFENIKDVKEETHFKGFQTASNNKIEISEDTLARSKKIFENIDLDIKPFNTEKYTKFKGFETASNKKVNVSAQGLSRSSKIFENVETVPFERVKQGAFQGFQTASNKKVNISEAALARSRKIFENINTEIEVDATSFPKNNAFQGFQTGNNKKVNISEEAVVKSRKLLENTESEKCVFESPVRSSFRGFQTASNKEVKISNEALAKTRGIFQDVDTTFGTADTSADLEISQIIPVELANNTMKNVCKIIFNEPKIIMTDSNTKEHVMTESISVNLTKDTVNIENVIDTQVLKDFDDSLHTEDFSKAITPVKSKRSGSPILSCPKAKRRRKFEIPYNKTQKNILTLANIDTNKNDDIKQKIHIFDKIYKKTKKYNLTDIQNMEKNTTNTQNCVDPYILEYDFENLLCFEFIGTRNELSNEMWTTDDMKKYFLNSVNNKFVPDGWLDNHLKLIIWKLISYEIKFPKTMGVVCTSKNVLEQLKYRYDKELFNSERPALRKILEKDDVSTKLIVLCVVAVYEDGINMDKISNQKTVELLLTDGWYCVRACLDRMLSKLVADGKIAVGTKIVTCGAELVGCEQGIAPWEDTSQVRLKLSGNSTRRARWLARLGYHSNGAILSRLCDVRPDGGRVAKLRVFVTRVYPTLYIEKFDDGSTVTRSERLELLHQTKYENERQGLLEKLYEEVQKEFSDEESQDSEVEPELKQRWWDSGSQIARAMKRSRDPAEFRSNLTETQIDLLNDHSTRKRDRLIQNIQARVEERIAESGLNVRRNVVPLMKIRIADVREGENLEVTKGLMSIWKPNDAVTEIVKEGAWIEAINVIPTAIRYSEIQISAGRQSVFSESKHKESEKVKSYTKTMKRICYTIKDLAKNPSMTTEYNEIDTAGLIFLIEPSIKEFDSNKNQFQNVYLADANKNIICVNFWGGLKKLGFENILDTGQIVACVNLQKRAGNTRKNIPQYRVTEFSHFTKTPKNDIARNICEDMNKNLQRIDRMKFCEDCVTLKNNYTTFKMQNYNENISPYRWQNIDLNLSKNKMCIDSPLVAKGGKNDENLNLSGLDFESTFKQVDTQEFSPKTVLRKRQIKEKIDKLKMYGEPPALSSIQILNISKNAGSAFKSPLPKSDISKGVANASEILLKEINVQSSATGSPILFNKTFVKRTNVNPVKLDFDSVAIDESNVSDSIDHFAEEFDGSPPLSLD